MMKKNLKDDILLRMQFYSQYLFQYVVMLPTLVWTGNPPEPSHDEWGIQLFEPEVLRKVVDNEFPLMLRAIEDITDEEAIEVAKMYRPESHWLHEAKYAKSFMVDFGASKNYFDAASRAADYLRSIGVALPFMGHTVEELIEAGWIKLLEK
jgi:hypothetical protein